MSSVFALRHPLRQPREMAEWVEFPEKNCEVCDSGAPFGGRSPQPHAPKEGATDGTQKNTDKDFLGCFPCSVGVQSVAQDQAGVSLPSFQGLAKYSAVFNPLI